MKKILASRSLGLFYKPQLTFCEMSRFKNSFLNPTNLNYIESLYENWLVDRQSVSPSFSAYF